MFGAVLAAEGKEGQRSEQLKLLQLHIWAGSSLGKGPRNGWLCWMQFIQSWGCPGAGTYTGICAKPQWQGLLASRRGG